MPSSIEDAQEQILALLVSSIAPRSVYEQGVPDGDNVRRDAAGKVVPYVAVQFGDISEGATNAMIGPRGDDYTLQVRTQCVAADAKTARRLANKTVNVLLGMSFPWTGNIRKRLGGGMWGITASNSATEAYVFPASFNVTVQYNNPDL